MRICRVRNVKLIGQIINTYFRQASTERPSTRILQLISCESVVGGGEGADEMGVDVDCAVGTQLGWTMLWLAYLPVNRRGRVVRGVRLVNHAYIWSESLVVKVQLSLDP